MEIFLCILVGYLIGSFPTGVVLTRKKYGLDVREMGSGNIGATNVTRVFGWYAGIIVFAIDCAKAVLPLLYVQFNHPEDPWLLTYTGWALVIGHCFSVFLGFKGGKGVATTLGCILIVEPLAAVLSGFVYFILLYLTQISAVGSLAGILTANLFILWQGETLAVKALVWGISVIVLVRHKENILRLVQGLQKKG